MIKIKDWYTEKGFEHNNFYFFEKNYKILHCMFSEGRTTNLQFLEARDMSSATHVAVQVTNLYYSHITNVSFWQPSSLCLAKQSRST